MKFKQDHSVIFLSTDFSELDRYHQEKLFPRVLVLKREEDQGLEESIFKYNVPYIICETLIEHSRDEKQNQLYFNYVGLSCFYLYFTAKTHNQDPIVLINQEFSKCIISDHTGSSWLANFMKLAEKSQIEFEKARLYNSIGVKQIEEKLEKKTNIL